MDEHMKAHIPVSAELISDTAGMADAIKAVLDGTAPPRQPEPRPPIPASHLALLEATDGALRAVVELHAPHWDGSWWWCNGCDAGAYAEEKADWPCSTADLITEQLGVAGWKEE
jgi:hypothetical protein